MIIQDEGFQQNGKAFVIFSQLEATDKEYQRFDKLKKITQNIKFLC